MDVEDYLNLSLSIHTTQFKADTTERLNNKLEGTIMLS